MRVSSTRTWNHIISDVQAQQLCEALESFPYILINLGSLFVLVYIMTVMCILFTHIVQSNQ